MDTTVVNFCERARKNEAAILHGFAVTGLEPIARQLGVDQSTVSRMKQSDISKMSTALAVCGLKVVPAEMKCYDPENIANIFSLARLAMNNMSPGQLEFED